MTSQPPLPRVDGRQCPASSECCPACLGSLSGLRRIAVRNRSETLSAFPECAPSWLAGREACGARANIVRSQTFVFGRHRGRDANDLCAAPGLSAKAGLGALIVASHASHWCRRTVVHHHECHQQTGCASCGVPLSRGGRQLSAAGARRPQHQSSALAWKANAMQGPCVLRKRCRCP